MIATYSGKMPVKCTDYRLPEKKGQNLSVEKAATLKTKKAANQMKLIANYYLM